MLGLAVDNQNQVVLDVRNLRKYFPVRRYILSRGADWLKAVDDVSFSIRRGETLGLVGESGCGKTTLSRSVLRLIEPTSGTVHLDGVDILSLNKEELLRARAKFQIIFQDPFSSLDPRMTVEGIIAEPLTNHLQIGRKEVREQVASLMKRVGLFPDQMHRYPHEFSGGQRQRIGIARALALNPKVVVCDEPVSALDVSIQAQVINLLTDLQRELGVSYLFIAHNLSMVEHISHRVAVMYLGRIIELARDIDLYQDPRHPYTQALLSAVPVADPERKVRRIVLEGDVPSPLKPPEGCAFHPRCSQRRLVCSEGRPALTEIGTDHYVACHVAAT